MTTPFETALSERVEQMLDTCTRCGKCVEVCPITDAAGVSAEPTAVISGVLDIVRHGDGPEASRKWASSCVLSGECIKACDYGVNPRFLLTMARVAMARHDNEIPERRRRGVEDFRKVSRDVTHLSKLQLPDELLERLGQKRSGPEPEPAEPPDFVFYTGCNVLKTPHIALLALDIMDALGITYRVMGGPTHCCGIVQMRPGDTETSGRMAENTMDKLASSKTGKVLSWCPSCHVQFTETTLPTIERSRGARPFEMTPFMLFLRDHLDRLRPLLKQRVPMRIALHRHPGVAGVVAAAETILQAVPGIELQQKELEACRAAGVDALVAVYHADHRELCAHERDWPFRIMNLLEIVGASMGLHHDDHFKRLKKLQDVDAIIAECQDLAARHGLNTETARSVVGAMLAEQPLPLRGEPVG
jgi:Fe-S oxidoreductase